MNARRFITTSILISCATGCVVDHSMGSTPQSVKLNGEAAPILQSYDIVEEKPNPGDSLVKRWDNDKGLLFRVDGSFVWRCGYPVKLEAGNRTAFGRLVLFNHREMADTPAGHGNYTIQVGPEVLDRLDGGRRYALWEQYRVNDNLYYAWILILAEEPLPCTGSL